MDLKSVLRDFASLGINEQVIVHLKRGGQHGFQVEMRVIEKDERRAVLEGSVGNQAIRVTYEFDGPDGFGV